MAELDRQLLAMKFELAFEVEKAVLNGDLEPSEILSLSKTIRFLSSTSSGLPPAAFRFFVTTLQGRRRRMHSRASMTRAAPLLISLEQQLIDATKYYSVKSNLKITSYIVSPGTFECYHLNCHTNITVFRRSYTGPVK